jgi:hypothetical protein
MIQETLYLDNILGIAVLKELPYQKLQTHQLSILLQSFNFQLIG